MSFATDRLIKNARTRLPGSLDNVIQLELFNVLDIFFRESGIWTEDVTFSVTASDPVGTVYYIEPESVSSIVGLISVRSSTDFPQKAMMELPGEVTLMVAPSQNDTYTATVSLSIVDPMQIDGYPEFPAWVLEKHFNGILHGVLGWMMSQPAKPYTHPQLASAHLKAFKTATSVAGTLSVRKNVQNAQAWAFPQQFATHSRRR